MKPADRSSPKKTDFVCLQGSRLNGTPKRSTSRLRLLVCGCNEDEAHLVAPYGDYVEVVYLPSYDIEEVREEIDRLQPHFVMCGADFLLRSQSSDIGKPANNSPVNGRSVRLNVTSRPLTDREVTVLTMVSKGLTNREVGETLAVSPRSVKRILKDLFVHLGVTNRTELTWRVGELHLIENPVQDEEPSITVIRHSRAPFGRTPEKSV